LSPQRHPHVMRLVGAFLDPPESCFLDRAIERRDARGVTTQGAGSGGRGRRRPPPPPLVDRVSRALEIAASLPPPPLEESEAAGSDTILHSITGLLQQRCDRRSVPRKKMGRARGRGGAQVMYRKKQNDPVSCVMGGKGE
jgi:spore coat protein CotH